LISCITVSSFAQAFDLHSDNDSLRIDNLNSIHQIHFDTLQWALPFRDSLCCYAETFIGTPYRYGAKGPSAFDCSGFTAYVFSKHGISLASSSTTQYKESVKIVSLDSALVGDLIFFMGRNGRSSVGHVGIVVDVDTINHKCRFIHAATHGGVIMTNYPSSSYYNQRFMGIGRYVLPEYITQYQLRRNEKFDENTQSIHDNTLDNSSQTSDNTSDGF